MRRKSERCPSPDEMQSEGAEMAKVLTLDEVIASTEPVMAEWIGFKGIEFVKVSPDREKAPGIVTFDGFTKARTEDVYGNQWRCWDQKPDGEDLKREGKLPVKPVGEDD
ncbi:MAG: hypothetical protein IJ088_13285 [Clostridia bacterium]|nr:hypothetical protein [Clostridia bacterium]